MMIRVPIALAVAITLVLAIRADNYGLAAGIVVGVVVWTVVRNVLETRQRNSGWKRID